MILAFPHSRLRCVDYIMKKPFLFLAFFCLLCRLSAQEVQVNEDPKISALYKSWTNKNRSIAHVDGWRVQVIASTDRTQVESGRSRFRLEYSEISAEWVHEPPYYKLRVGAFRSKEESLAFIAELRGWPGAYPIKDAAIHPRDFLEQ
jgi:SPOR domain